MGVGSRVARAHLLLGATLTLPNVGGHDALHLLPQPGILLQLGRGGRGESHVHRGAPAGGTPTPPESRDPGAWGGRTHRRPEMRGREAWGPRKLKAPSHGHPFPQVWVPNSNSGVFGVPGPLHWPTWALLGGGQFPWAEMPWGPAFSAMLVAAILETDYRMEASVGGPFAPKAFVDPQS